MPGCVVVILVGGVGDAKNVRSELFVYRRYADRGRFSLRGSLETAAGKCGAFTWIHGHTTRIPDMAHALYCTWCHHFAHNRMRFTIVLLEFHIHTCKGVGMHTTCHKRNKQLRW